MTAYTVRRDMLDTSGMLPSHANGCYTILYAVEGTDTVLCAKCATAAFHAGVALVHGSFDEGAPVECEGASLYAIETDCDAEIASSYGDPDADDEPEPDDPDDGPPDSCDPPDSDGF